MPVSQQTLAEIALTEEEYGLIVQKLDREPTPVELGMFGALWSEHCGYKHSKPLLGLLPSTGDLVQVAAGEENAGAVDIGDGIWVVFKVESHNHPSAVEPFQGAATGVGGIIRDILAMGARPIALLNSLRFGPLTEPRNRYLFDGVVAGISAYGNCIGIPDVGGEVAFAQSYTGNPLVNPMCVGLLNQGELVRSAAVTPGNILALVGAATGRDGIHGASGLASRTFAEEREMRTTVQVGDPFLEKVLVEACLEAARTGYLEGMQDLGAAGLTSSAVECASRGGSGIWLDVALVPRREAAMTPYEVMLSESQERMLLVVKKGHEADLQRLFERWDLPFVTIGEVTGDRRAKVYDGPELVADTLVQTLVEAPQYRPAAVRPAYLAGLHAIPMPATPPSREAGALLASLLASPNIASKRSIYRQYDHEVQTNTVVKPGQADAAVLRLRGSSKGLAVSIDGNGRYAYLEPYAGGALAVAEACRNVTCTGAKPLAITDCLNFGDPRNPEVYYQLKECIQGMADACKALGVPVVSGNVSLYNETHGQSVYPTPVVGAVGVLADVRRHVTAGFRSESHIALLLGVDHVVGDDQALAGSEYLSHVHGLVAGQPRIDLRAESRLQAALVSLIEAGLVESAHDCSDGGLAVTLAECCLLGGIGFQWEAPFQGRWDSLFFGEVPSRVVVSVTPEKMEEATLHATMMGVPYTNLGIIKGARLVVPGLLDEAVETLAEAYEGGMEGAARG